MQQLDTLARQIAIALERVHYVDVAQQAVVEMESERLRNALLAAISHDVRTPLTALIGLAETLRQSQPALTQAQADTAQARGRPGTRTQRPGQQPAGHGAPAKRRGQPAHGMAVD